MLKRLLYISVILAGITLKVGAVAPLIDVNSLKTILKIEDRVEREKKIVGYIKTTLLQPSEFDLPATKKELNNTLAQLHVENSVAFEYFTESMYQRRLMHLDDAEAAMVKAIKFAGYNHDHFLMYSFLSHLAFIQTDEGNAIDAVESYGLSKKEALKVSDPHLQLQVDVNMSDVFYKNNFYSQSLFYLNQAELLNKKYGSDDVNV
ncbi:MAG: hypothetical protein ABIN13_07875, partial [Mucilaginibacter sp.]